MSTGYITVTNDGSLQYLQFCEGYETYGAQAADLPEHADMAKAILQSISVGLAKEARAHAMDHAIAALHGQHSCDGRPSRFMPDVEPAR